MIGENLKFTSNFKDGFFKKMKVSLKRAIASSMLAAMVSGGTAETFAQTKGAITGPSSSESPYVVRTVPGVVTKSILTVGDSVNLKPDGTPYRMVGIPDGLGAYDNGDGTFTVLMNQELGSTAGVVRAHGAAGSFVSKWVIRKDDLTVINGSDLINQIYLWNPATAAYEPAAAALNRLCSADLPDEGAFYNPETGRGTTARIFMNGEETSNGRAFAHVATGSDAGKSWDLPWMGKFAWENSVASPQAQDKTIVMGLDDSDRRFSSEGEAEPSEVYVWVGEKQASGSEIAKAGLRTGVLTGVRVGTPGNYDANELTVISGERFELAQLTDQTANTTYVPLQTESIQKSVTQFRRVEDGAFDPKNPNDFYFVTTDNYTGNSKLFRLRFDNITNPGLGGVIEILLDGTEGQRMMDNIGMNKRGQIMIQEDIGGQDALGKIWRYNIAEDTLNPVAEHDPYRFLPGSPGYLTRDEESSGIIDVSHILGEGWFLLDVQAHYNIGDAELVQNGQLLALHNPPGRK